MFLLFSGADRLYFEFREKFLATYQADVDACSGPLEVSVVDQANHIFTFTAWQDDMLARGSVTGSSRVSGRTAMIRRAFRQWGFRRAADRPAW